MNKLYFGDNLEILREMDDQRVDLICTDPPFNSGRNYNAFFTDSLAQNKVFTDIWTWDTAAEEARADTEQRARARDTYKVLDTCLKGYDMVLQNAVSGNKGAMRAYLAFMGPRLAEMHRILKDTGSIYLHCDPTASHYLKGVMDTIWDQSNRKANEFFQNELVWGYRTGGVSKKRWARKHDILLFYAKSKKYQHNPLQERVYYEKPFFTVEKDAHGHYYADVYVRDVWDDILPLLKQSDIEKDVFFRDIWQDIKPLINLSKERLGYDTQKPRALYERMIKASSNPGDLVLDPFCGCGTTIDAAHTLNRFWMGIDVTILALDPMRERLRDRHGLEPSKDYEIDGYPTNMQEVRKLVSDENKRHDFSNWAVTRLGLTPTPDVGDGGKDGVGRVTLWNPQQMEETPARILAEVKSGGFSIGNVREFCHTMTRLDAIAGIFTTIEDVSAGMRQIAADMGTFAHNNVTYPRLQFWQIDEAYFENPEVVKTLIRLPGEWLRPIQKSERHFTDQQTEFQM